MSRLVKEYKYWILLAALIGFGVLTGNITFDINVTW